MNSAYWTFGVYILLMAGIGIYFSRKASEGMASYLLGCRSMGSWVTAFSAQASDMSGWLLMGLPGAVFLGGFSESWIAIGLWGGTLLNWLLVSGRLRIFTEASSSLTVSSFLGERFGDPTRAIRCLSAALTLFFFTIYAASGLASAGRLFESLFGVSFQTAVLVGAAVMIFYTLLGGFLAVCWTDLIQGILMFCALVILPGIVLYQLPAGAIVHACEVKHISLNLFPAGGGFWSGLLLILSTASWGFGYFGQPHILSRFMAIRSVRLLPRTIWIAMIWVTISLAAAVLIGFLAIPLYPNAEYPLFDVVKPNNEKIFLYMIEQFSPAVLAGVWFAAILAAVMSTIDSQLLASSSTLVADLYCYLVRPKATQKEQLWMSHAAVLVTSVLATLLALNPNQTIFSLVKFAWGGLGAVFGPAVLAGLYCRRASYAGILAGMGLGTLVLLGWYYAGWGAVLYEIVPGILANVIGIAVFSWLFPPRAGVIAWFDVTREQYKKARQK